MTNTEWMVRGNFLARIERAESLLSLPSLLPLGFDQVKRILPATACHRADIIGETNAAGQSRSLSEPAGIVVPEDGNVESTGCRFLDSIAKILELKRLADQLIHSRQRHA